MSDTHIFSRFPGGFQHWPEIAKARLVKQFSVGNYRAILVADCESTGMVRHTFVLYFRKQEEAEPYFAIASELSDALPDEGKRYLALFYLGIHVNIDYSSDWLDIEKFTARALKEGPLWLGVRRTPVEELPIETEPGFNLPFLKGGRVIAEP